MSVVMLPNYPVRDQLNPLTPTRDGQAPENGRMDCVFDSFSSGVEKLTGQVYVGDDIKDFVKGQNYTGAGNAAWLTGAVAAHFGVSIWSFNSSDQHRLIAALRDDLAQGRPSLVTIPSAWNSQPSVAGYNPFAPNFPTHVCALYGIDGDLNPAGEAWLMNPWPGYTWGWPDGHRQRVTVAWLQRRLCYGATWPMQALPPTFHDVAALPGWEDDGKLLRKKGSPFGFVRGFRQMALLHPELFTGFFSDQEPLENERPCGAGSEQILTYVKFVWTPAGGCRLEANLAA